MKPYNTGHRQVIRVDEDGKTKTQD